jgi:hypothetical protein
MLILKTMHYSNTKLHNRRCVMRVAEAFNQSWFSRFINSPAGRVFRLAVGAGFLVVGYLYRDNTLGVIAMVFSVLPLSAGAFDLCYVSAVLGGPLSGAKIRESQRRQ